MRISNLMTGGALSLLIAGVALAEQARPTWDVGCERPAPGRMSWPERVRPQRPQAPDWAADRTGGERRPARPPRPEWITERRARSMPQRPATQNPNTPGLQRPTTPPRNTVRPDSHRPEPPAWVSDRRERPSRDWPDMQRPARPGWADRDRYGAMHYGAMPPHVGRTPGYPGWGAPSWGAPGWSSPGNDWGYRNPWAWMPPVVEAPVPAPPPPAKPVPAPAAAAPEPTPVARGSDGDADGVQDSADLCANTSAGTAVDPFGCAKDVPIVLRGVNFETDAYLLTPDSTDILDRVSATLLAHPEIKAEVTGHTDSDGDDADNKQLSQLRAETVMRYLTGQGVNPENLTARGYGEEQPVTTNDTEAGKAQNRRVELNRR